MLALPLLTLGLALSPVVPRAAAPQTSTPAPAQAARPAAPPATPGTGSTTPRTPPAAATGSLMVRVVDRSGSLIDGALVSMEGPSSREGTTDASGMVQLKTLASGTYRVQAAHAGFFTMEREVVVRGATPMVELSLTAAPPPPPPPPPPPAPEPIVDNGAPGTVRVLSLIDLAEKSLGGREAVKYVPIGCSGLTLSELLVVRDPLQGTPAPVVDQMLYLIAGEATLTLDGRDQALTGGWYGLVPRGTAFTVTRKGRNPAILLAVTVGKPCPAAVAR